MEEGLKEQTDVDGKGEPKDIIILKSDAVPEVSWYKRVLDFLANSSLLLFHRESLIRRMLIKVVVPPN